MMNMKELHYFSLLELNKNHKPNEGYEKSLENDKIFLNDHK